MSIIRQVEKLLWKLHKPVIHKNVKFKDIHKGETCLIFGNGAGLKFYNFEALPKVKTIGCTYSLTDKRAKSLKLNYCVFSDPYLFYPFRIRPDKEKGKIHKNLIAPIFKKVILNNPETIFFASLTNYYSFFKNPKNLYFDYHFGERASMQNDLSGIFGGEMSFSALSIMIGLAKYMGFSKAIVLGCDYLGSPLMESHFYAEYKPFFGKDARDYCERVKKISNGIDILCIFPKGIKSLDFNYASFEEYFGSPEIYQENKEIIDPLYMDLMLKAAEVKQIWIKE